MLVGYAFLLDQDGLIRWRAVGKALPEEIESMLKHTRTLMKVKLPNTKTKVGSPILHQNNCIDRLIPHRRN